MALLGGGVGGAGNPVGGSFTGPAQALEIIGDYAYAFSGAVASPDSATPDARLLEFQTGNFVLVCNVQFVNESTGNSNTMVQFKLNDSVVMANKYQIVGGYAGDISQIHYALILPPYTQFQMNFSIDGDTENGYAALTGRIYRTRD